MQAASEVFAEKRFLDTNVSDIVQRAGTAHGTFYRYFNSKEEIFREVALELQRAMLDSSGEDDGPTRPADRPQSFESLEDEMLWRITRANRRYLHAYRRHAALFAVVEQVATFSDELREIRRELRRAFVDRAQRSIERMQAEGLACRDVDARYAASALGSMVDRFAYVWLVLEEDFDEAEVVENLTTIWFQAIGGVVPTR